MIGALLVIWVLATAAALFVLAEAVIDRLAMRAFRKETAAIREEAHRRMRRAIDPAEQIKQGCDYMKRVYPMTPAARTRPPTSSTAAGHDNGRRAG